MQVTQTKIINSVIVDGKSLFSGPIVLPRSTYGPELTNLNDDYINTWFVVLLFVHLVKKCTVLIRHKLVDISKNSKSLRPRY